MMALHSARPAAGSAAMKACPPAPPLVRKRVKLAFMPISRMPRPLSDVEHEDAVAAAVTALDAERVRTLINVNARFPFWPCMHSLCHAYSTETRWTQVTAMLVLARAGEWKLGSPLPVTLPSPARCAEVLCTGITEAMFGDAAWSVDALRVLLSLGVPTPDLLTLNELLAAPLSFAQHTRAVADHFAAQFITRDELLERLSHALERVAQCSPGSVGAQQHWAAAQLLMRVFFRWHLEDITPDAWMRAMLAVVPSQCVRSAVNKSVSVQLAARLPLALHSLSLSVAVRQEFDKLATEEDRVGARTWCPKLQLQRECGDLLCKFVHTRVQLLERNPLLRLTLQRDRLPWDELSDAVWDLSTASATPRCMFALKNVLLLLQTAIKEGQLSAAQLHKLSVGIVKQVGALKARAYYYLEVEQRVLMPLLKQYALATSEDNDQSLSFQTHANEYFNRALASSTPRALSPPLRVLVEILSLLEHRYVAATAHEEHMLFPYVQAVHFRIGSSPRLTVPTQLMPLFINFHVSANKLARQPALIGACHGEFKMCGDLHASKPLAVHFTHVEIIFSSAEELVRALQRGIDDGEAGSILLHGREQHSDYLDPQLLWFTPHLANIHGAPASEAPSLTRTSSRYGPFRVIVPLPLLFENEHARCLCMGTRHLQHMRLLSGRTSNEYAHCALVTSRPAFAVGNPFESQSDRTWTISSCAIPEMNITEAHAGRFSVLSVNSKRDCATWRVTQHSTDHWDELRLVVPRSQMLLRARDGVRIDFVAHALKSELDNELCHCARKGPCAVNAAAAAREFLDACAKLKVEVASFDEFIQDPTSRLLLSGAAAFHEQPAPLNAPAPVVRASASEQSAVLRTDHDSHANLSFHAPEYADNRAAASFPGAAAAAALFGAGSDVASASAAPAAPTVAPTALATTQDLLKQTLEQGSLPLLWNPINSAPSHNSDEYLVEVDDEAIDAYKRSIALCPSPTVTAH